MIGGNFAAIITGVFKHPSPTIVLDDIQEKAVNISADKVKQQRQKKGWTQEVLAKASGLSLRTVQRLEREGGGSGETLQALAAAFEVEVAELFAEYPIPQSRWTKEKLMHGFIALFVLLGAVGLLMKLAGELKMFWDFYTLAFAIFFTCAATISAFGVSGLIKSFSGLRYLFSDSIDGGKATGLLAQIYQKQIWFCYGGGIIGVMVGVVATHANYPMIEATVTVHRAYAVNILLLLYCAIYCEAVLRPLVAKLQVSDID